MGNFVRKIKWTTFLLSFILILPSLSAYGFRVVGYMPSWAGAASSIQYDKLTHINYSFAIPDVDGNLKPISNISKLQSIVTLAHAAGVKVFIAVGGYSEAGVPLDPRFESIGGNATYRNNLVNSIMNAVNTYNLDGVDMDWEYPDPGTSADNYALLMSALSDTLHTLGKELSAAVIATGSTGGGVKNEVFGYVDWLNLMAYDSGQLNHSTYAFAQTSISYWKGRGLPVSKIVLGVPFYGYSPYRSYSSIVASDPNAPYNDESGGVHYNGIETIKDKTLLAVVECSGIMIWELSQDTNDNTSLLKAIDDMLSIALNTPKANFSGVKVNTFPNPIESRFEITIQNSKAVKIESVMIVSAEGKTLFESLYKEGQIYDVEALLPGLYFLQLRSNNSIIYTGKVIKFP